MSINVIIFIEFGIVGDLIGMIANIERLRGYELDLLKRTESSIWDYYNVLLAYPNYEIYDIIHERSIVYEDVNSANMTNIRKQMGFHKLRVNEDEIKYLTYLKKSAFEILHFEGKTLKDRIYDGLSVQEIVSASKQDGFALNCRYISHIFCQILLSVGFKARWVVCLSSDLMNRECHCVTEVYINDLNKWIIADAALGAFYFNEKGQMLNLYEMRKLYTNGKMPIIVANRMKEAEELQLYWMKNIFRFRFIKYNGTEALKGKQHYWGLNPKGFEMIDKSYTDICTKKEVDIKYSNDARAFWKID